MKKIFLFFVLSASLFSQEIRSAKSIVLKADMYKFFEKKIGIIDSVNGQDWICIPKNDLVFDSGEIIMIEGFPVVFSENREGIVTIEEKRCDLIQLNFNTKQKTIIQNGSYQSCFGFPDDARHKTRQRLIDMRRRRNANKPKRWWE